MNILIAYASKSGTTETCVHILENDFNGHVTLIDLTHTDPSLDAFDTILIGGPIRFGRLHSSVKKFMRSHLEELKQKDVALFICCGFMDDAEQHIQNNFPLELVEQAKIIECFGGEIRKQALGVIDMFIANLALKSRSLEDQPHILDDRIHLFAEQVNALDI